MSVLVAINGSSYFEAMVRLGAHIAQRGHEPLTVLTVLRHEAEEPHIQADAILAQACEFLLPRFTNVRTRVRIGHPATEIVREAEEGGYHLVIVGKRQGRNLLTRFLLGSTAVRVVEHAPCPVIVAQGKVGPIRRLLLCDSGAVGPSVLSRFTAQLADLIRDEDEVTILHVMSQMSAGPGVQGKQLRAGVEELIQEHAPEGELLELDIEALERFGIHARASVRHGLVVEEILEEAQRGDYDLVVIGAYRGQGWQRILLDDLAHRLVVELDRPVLVVR